MEQQWKKQQASQCHGGSDFAKSPPALMICVHQCVRIYIIIYVFACVYIRPVHKNLFLEFPKYPGRFMLHFDI